MDGRSRTRSSAALAFELPYSRCAGGGRKQFISSVGEYYYRRQNETERYPEAFGKPGADYIAKQRVTGKDKRIERLTQEAYAQGYLQPPDFDAVARKMSKPSSGTSASRFGPVRAEGAVQLGSVPTDWEPMRRLVAVVLP